VLAAMAGEHARIDPLPAEVDTVFASPARDRLADVSDTLATTLTSHSPTKKPARFPDPHRFHRRRVESGMADSHSHRLSTGAGILALTLDGLSRRCGCYRSLETPVGKVSHR
jgi:hypothetical protein